MKRLRPPGRRAFLKAGAASLTTCLLQPTLAAARPRFSLRYIVGSSMYGNLKLAEILPQVPGTGATAIDLWARIHGTQRMEAEQMGPGELADRLRTHRVKLGATTRFDLRPMDLADEIRFVAALGGDLIVVGQKGVNPPGTGAKLREEVRQLVEQLKPLLQAAAERRVQIAIQNHAGKLIDGRDSLGWLTEFSAGLPLGVAFAPAQLPQDAAALADLVRLVGSKIFLFYAWQSGSGFSKALPKDEELTQLPGRGRLDFVPLMQALRDIQFRGWTEILMLSTPRGFPIQPTAEMVTAEIAQARKHLEDCVGKTT